MTDRDHNKIVSDSTVYFNSSGSGWMKLDRKAAEDVIHKASESGLLIGMIEGGKWQNPGFMSQLDAIWKSVIDPPCSEDQVWASNRDALNFIKTTGSQVDVFILTALRRRVAD